MMDKKISIIIPVYKVELYLEESVKSVLNQTYQNLEIILVDDGSPDKCPEICDKLAKEDSRIKVIHKENGGLSSARNAGLDIATGDYILFVDSDDTINPQMCEILLNNLIDTNADVSMCSMKKIQSIDNPKDKQYNLESIKYQIFENDEVFSLLFNKKVQMISAAWAKLYKKEIFDNIRFPLGKIHEDEATIHEILAECNKAVYVELPMYNNLQRGDSITGEAFNKKRLNALDALKQRVEFVKNKKPQFLNDSINQYVKILILYYYYSKWSNFDNNILDSIRKEIDFYCNEGYDNKLTKMFYKHPRILNLLLKIRQKIS